jgi:hypothetical protein
MQNLLVRCGVLRVVEEGPGAFGPKELLQPAGDRLVPSGAGTTDSTNRSAVPRSSRRRSAAAWQSAPSAMTRARRSGASGVEARNRLHRPNAQHCTRRSPRSTFPSTPPRQPGAGRPRLPPECGTRIPPHWAAAGVEIACGRARTATPAPPAPGRAGPAVPPPKDAGEPRGPAAPATRPTRKTARAARPPGSRRAIHGSSGSAARCAGAGIRPRGFQDREGMPPKLEDLRRGHPQRSTHQLKAQELKAARRTSGRDLSRGSAPARARPLRSAWLPARSAPGAR